MAHQAVEGLPGTDRAGAPAALLQIEDLAVDYRLRGRRTFRAIDGVSVSVQPGETVGLVGESGSGKSTIGRAVLGLAKTAAGSIEFQGHEISGLSRRRRAALAGDLQVVFQDPYSSLNPALTIGQILREPLQVRRKLSAREAQAVVVDLLTRVALPADAADRYPGSFSGGQRQRIAIARALSVGARLIVCDESVSALDVSTQAQVLALLQRLQAELGVAYLFISHDIAVVQHLSDRVVVLYRGRVMEQGPADRVCSTPLHPYTRLLLDAAPVPHPELQRRKREARLATAAAVPTAVAAAGATGSVPVTADACPFAARCPFAEQVCTQRRPALTGMAGVQVQCHLYDETSGHTRAGTVDPAIGIR
ncbi:ATP-binding cassette domain-containing protein [Modestobacter sp. VKM Ac-2986]|uniref:oligopeptide/dipeptide ABC transporter ATP-binding protein n=1 Tax=Modestobacter sp. VKM Ac-2986 TaxID=3004140 RepID=UPI0022AAA623|nr:oligopeptide/dipeptide ABC transporter ATP-binding protein [Modestobacter sp. VKM Ac-2986]MCZ2827728.1 ATP-binding cassette domain-containing protein [Modestobacter sp. VKM Ac-2986]